VTQLKLKYIHRFKDRHGKLRHYFRRPGQKQIPLSGLPGSAEFMEAYQAALTNQDLLTSRLKAPPGSIRAAVLSYYQSGDFTALADTTKRTYRRGLDRLVRDHGTKPLRQLQAHHIRVLMNEKAETPHAANFLLQMFHVVMRHAVEMGWRRDNPCADVRKIRVKSDGFHTWTEAEIEQFERRWARGSRQRLAFDLLLHTGQRSADVRQMTRAQFSGDYIKVRQQKTGEWLDIPVSSGLNQSLRLVPSDQFVLLMTSFGRPFTEKGFSNYVSKAADTAGMPHCSAHGLRKASARRLAEAGCSASEIMSITGHRTLQEVTRYTARANQKMLATSAAAKLARDSVANPD